MNNKAERYCQLSLDRVRKRRALQKLKKDYIDDDEPPPRVFCMEANIENNDESITEKLCGKVAEKLCEAIDNSDFDESSFLNELECDGLKGDDHTFSISDEIRQWVQESGIDLSVADQLLKKLKKFHPELPLCIQTLMKTEYIFKKKIRQFDPSNDQDDSEFVYFGILEQLKQIVCLEAHPDRIIRLLAHSRENLCRK